MIRACDTVEPMLSAWIDDELTPAERAKVAAHLQRCPRCRNAVRDLRITATLLRSMPARRTPAGLYGTPVPTLFGIPEPADPPPATARVRRAVTRSLAGAVGAVLLLGATAFAVGGQPEPQHPQVAVPVDVFVGDHLVRAAGGPVSTPALLPTAP